MTTPKPDAKALLAAAEQMDRTWDQWMTDDDDAMFGAVEEAIASLRKVLGGTRRMRLSKDQYGYWRSRCECGWPGSPWSGGLPEAGDWRSPRQQAIDEYAAHVCIEQGA